MVKEKKDTKELLNELEQEMVRVEKEKVDLRNDKERIAYLEHLCENIKAVSYTHLRAHET